MVIIAGHDVLLIKTVGELRGRETGEKEDIALQGFHPMPAGLTVCSLSGVRRRCLFLVSFTCILKGQFNYNYKQTKFPSYLLCFAVIYCGISHEDLFVRYLPMNCCAG